MTDSDREVPTVAYGLDKGDDEIRQPEKAIAYPRYGENDRADWQQKAEFMGYNIVELVRREDHEAFVAQERSRKFEEGFFEGRESQREDVLELIDQFIEEKTDNVSKLKGEKQLLLESLREEVEQQDSLNSSNDETEGDEE